MMSAVAKPKTTIPVSGVPRIRISNRSGAITVTGEARGDVEVVGADAGAEPDGTVAVDGRSGKIEVRAPEGSDVIVGTASGRIRLRGVLGDVRATTGSGSIDVDHVARLDARSRSGSLEVVRCDGPCSLHTTSGSVTVGQAGDADLVAGSGSVVARRVSGARVKAVSGSVEVGLDEPGDVEIQAHSGSVHVTVPVGCCPTTRLEARSGAVRCDCAAGDDGHIEVVARSGSIVVTEA